MKPEKVKLFFVPLILVLHDSIPSLTRITRKQREVEERERGRERK